MKINYAWPFALLLFVATACQENLQEVTEQYHPDGSPKLVTVYQEGENGKIKVKEARYYKNGQMELKGQFNKEGQREGQWSYWYENGNLWSQHNYANGKREGKGTVWYENGQKRYEGQYTDDKPVGNWKFWSKQGQLVHQIDY